MAIMTYKEMVENILNDMDADPIFDNTPLEDIASTEESRQVVEILKATYFKIIDSREWPFLLEHFQMTPIGATSPTAMTLGSDITEIKYIKYNKRTTTDTKDVFGLVHYLEPQKFMNILDARDNNLATVDAITDPTSSITLNIINDTAPTYYTILGNNRVLFDSYDSVVDTTSIVAAKVQGYGIKYPTVTETDAFTFNLPTNMFSLLLEDAKSTAFIVLKQSSNQKADFNSIALRSELERAPFKGRQNYRILDTAKPAASPPQQQRQG